MNPIAISKANEHLELAKDAAEQLHLQNGYKSCERAWSQFLSQVSRFYSKLEQGAKGCKTSEPWFGKKKYERRTDPLLSYLHHARDCDEHSIDYITQRSADAISGRFPNSSEVTVSFDAKLDGQGGVLFKDLNITPSAGAVQEVTVYNPRVELVRVTDKRFNNHFDPPLMHLQIPIVDTSPYGVAHLAITYLEQTLKEALELPKAG